jgi:hypothetical protein
MPRYVSLHTVYHLNRQAAQELGERIRTASGIKVRRALLNMVEGKLLLDWDAADRETLDRWLAAQGFESPEWLVSMEYEIIDGQLLTV